MGCEVKRKERVRNRECVHCFQQQLLPFLQSSTSSTNYGVGKKIESDVKKKRTLYLREIIHGSVSEDHWWYDGL